MKRQVYVLALIAFACLGCEREEFTPAAPDWPSPQPQPRGSGPGLDYRRPSGPATLDPMDPSCIRFRQELIATYREMATERCQNLTVCIPACPGAANTDYFMMVIYHRCLHDVPSGKAIR